MGGGLGCVSLPQGHKARHGNHCLREGCLAKQSSLHLSETLLDPAAPSTGGFSARCFLLLQVRKGLWAGVTVIASAGVCTLLNVPLWSQTRLPLKARGGTTLLSVSEMVGHILAKPMSDGPFPQLSW